MGGSESKRRIVVEDANGEGVVQVTQAVVRRVNGQPDPPVQKSPKDFKKQSESSSNNEYRVPPKDSEKFKATTKEIEDFCMEKLNDLQKRSQELQDHSNEQFSNAVKEVEQKFMKYTSSPVCQDLQTKVLECYQANPNSVLDCSSIVTAFTTCVDRARMISILEGSNQTVSQSRSHDIRQAQPVS